MTAPAESPKQAPWVLQPGRLWSLWDMKNWDGAKLSWAHQQLAAWGQLMALFRDDSKGIQLLADDRQRIIDATTFVRDLAIEHDFPTVVGLAEESLGELNKVPAPQPGQAVQMGQLAFIQLLPRNDALVRSLEPTFRKRTMLALTAKGHALYTASEPLFGRDVFDKFPTTQRDIDEAGKCIAVKRNKAAVFHLMLSMEAALRVLAAKINARVLDKNGQFDRWGVILSNVKAAIPLLPLEDQEKWTSVHNLLWGVGKSWRNETMHPAEAYSDEEAESAFDAVKGFMRHLAQLI